MKGLLILVMPLRWGQSMLLLLLLALLLLLVLVVVVVALLAPTSITRGLCRVQPLAQMSGLN